MNLKPVALVTGASSGIGRTTALEFAKNGFDVILLSRSANKLDELCQQIGSTSWALPCDLEQPHSVDIAIKQIQSLGLDGRLNAIVNNAGIFIRSPFQETTLEQWLKMLHINFLSAIQLTSGLFEELKKSTQFFNTASVVNISSTASLRPVANTSAYSSLKAAMNSWTQNLALEWAPYRIRVNAICPGIVDTPIHNIGEQPESIQEQYAKMQPLGRVGRPEEIAVAARFLSGPDSQWTTGSLLTVDGGISLKG